MDKKMLTRLARSGLAMGMMMVVLLTSLGGALPARSAGANQPSGQVRPPRMEGPFLSSTVGPAVFNGNLNELARAPGEAPDTPGLLRYTPGSCPRKASRRTCSGSTRWRRAPRRTA